MSRFADLPQEVVQIIQKQLDFRGQFTLFNTNKAVRELLDTEIIDQYVDTQKYSNVPQLFITAITDIDNIEVLQYVFSANPRYVTLVGFIIPYIWDYSRIDMLEWLYRTYPVKVRDVIENKWILRAKNCTEMEFLIKYFDKRIVSDVFTCDNFWKFSDINIYFKYIEYDTCPSGRHAHRISLMLANSRYSDIDLYIKHTNYDHTNYVHPNWYNDVIASNEYRPHALLFLLSRDLIKLDIFNLTIISAFDKNIDIDVEMIVSLVDNYHISESAIVNITKGAITARNEDLISGLLSTKYACIVERILLESLNTNIATFIIHIIQNNDIDVSNVKVRRYYTNSEDAFIAAFIQDPRSLEVIEEMTDIDNKADRFSEMISELIEYVKNPK